MELELIKKFICDRKQIELEHLSKRHENINIGFNLFEIISDKYYRENLHSDLIRELLSPDGKHGEGTKYLQQFIYFLNSFKKHIIDIQLFENDVKVHREAGRRDITITNNKQAIIIENKINNASDTYNQIPKYVDDLEINKRVEVLLIIYLTLRQSKVPDENTWELTDKEEKKRLKDKLIIVRAFNGTNKDLCHGWLANCINLTNNIDNLAILRQYKRIIQHLSKNEMDQEHLKKFVSYLKHNNSLDVAKSIRDNVNQLCKYFSICFLNYFSQEERYLPFKNIKMYNDDFPFFEGYEIAGNYFNMDVKFDFDKCYIDFSVRRPSEYVQPPTQKVLEIIGMENEFSWSGERYVYLIHKDILESEKEAEIFCRLFFKLLIDRKDLIEKALSQLINK
jgi:hypothetical protein